MCGFLAHAWPSEGRNASNKTGLAARLSRNLVARFFRFLLKHRRTSQDEELDENHDDDDYQDEERVASWADVVYHAAHPGDSDCCRSKEVESEYKRYKEWLGQRGLDNAGFILKHTAWDRNGVAFTPNMLPYLTESGISHWVLWHHPRWVAGDSVLRQDAELAQVLEILGKDAASAAGVRNVRGERARAWGPREDEIVVFQNPPDIRSIPGIAHSHCFMRPLSDAAGLRLAGVLDARRLEWQAMSPWLPSVNVSKPSTNGTAQPYRRLATAVSRDDDVNVPLSAMVVLANIVLTFAVLQVRSATSSPSKEPLLAA